MAIQGFSVAFEDAWDVASPTWTRLDGTSGLVASYSIQRGRQDALAKTGTGTATVRLNDTAGLFDPSNVESDYFLAGLDGRQAGLALWNPVTETWRTIFRGFIDAYQFDVDPSGVVTRIEVELVDGLDYLAGCELSLDTAGDTPPPELELDDGDIFYENDEVDDRIKAVLDDAQWPLALRTIFSGNVEIKSVVYPPATPALSVLSDAADAEWPGISNIYVAGNGPNAGKVTFHGRHARFDPDGVSAEAGSAWDFTRWKVGDGSIASSDPTYAQLRKLSFSRSRKLIINAAMALPDRWLETALTPAEIYLQTSTHPDSIDTYGVRSWSAENLLTARQLGTPLSVTNDDLTETRKFAEYYVENFHNPTTQISSLGFRSIRPDDPRGPAVWALLAGVEISDIVQVRTVHPGGHGFADEEFFVEGISYDVQPLNGDYADVTLSLDVSPQAHYETDPFGDS